MNGSRSAAPAGGSSGTLVCVLASPGTSDAAVRVARQAGPGHATTVVLVVDDGGGTHGPASADVPVRQVRVDDVGSMLVDLAGDHREVVVVTSDLVAHDLAVQTVVEGPGAGARLLVGPAGAAPARAGSLVVQDGFVVGVDPVAVPGAPQPLGVLRVPTAALSSAAVATLPSDDLDPFLRLVAALVQSGTDVRTVERRGFVAERVRDVDERDAALDRVARVDQDRAAMDAAVKPHDGFFTTFFVSPYSRHVARWMARRGFTPNQVTVISMVLGAAAATTFAVGTLPWRVAGALLLQLAFTFDCVDGQLARYARQFSPFGAWLDGMFDRGKEYLVYVGLALGALRTGQGEGIWVLVAVTVALQTLRHHVDLAWNAQAAAEAAARRREGLRPRRSADATADPALIGVAHGLNRYPVLKWAKQVVTLPIGERFLLISVVAAVAGARATFVALLGWGAIAGAYTLTGRLLRSRR